MDLKKGTDNIWRVSRTVSLVSSLRHVPAKPVIALAALGFGGLLVLKGVTFAMGLFWWVVGMLFPWLLLAGGGLVVFAWLKSKFGK